MDPKKVCISHYSIVLTHQFHSRKPSFQKPVLMNVLNEASALKNILLLSVTDHFELCLAKCRTSSRSVQHENVYINPVDKHCFVKGPQTTTSQEPSKRISVEKDSKAEP